MVALVLAGCAGAATTTPAASPSQGSSPSAAASQPSADALVGDWARVQSCEEQLAAFEDAGLAVTHAGWITDNWKSAPSSTGGACEGAKPPEEHTHLFTADGRFGSRDANGDQVDDGDYEIVGPGTVSFPSHAEEFGYSGDLLVDYSIDGDTATFAVRLPDDCESSCQDAYAWALSAFFEGAAWTRE